MSRSERRKTVEAVAFRLDAQQAAIATEKAGRHGLSLGQYARLLVINDLGQALPLVRRGPPRDAAELRKIVASLGKIGSNLNQVAAAANTRGAIVDRTVLARVEADLATIRSMMAAAFHVKDS